MDKTSNTARRVVGGVDTHKDLHVAAVVDDHDHALGTSSFSSTRQGYHQMLAWLRSFGQGIDGLLIFPADSEVLADPIKRIYNANDIPVAVTDIR